MTWKASVEGVAHQLKPHIHCAHPWLLFCSGPLQWSWNVPDSIHCFTLVCTGRTHVEHSWKVCSWAVVLATDKCIDVHRTLVIEATLHYCKWDVRQVHCWPPPQTETDTGKGNSIFIVLPIFKERKCLNPLLSIAVWGCIEKTTQSWGNGSVGKVLASKCEDPSCTKSPIKTNHDGRPGVGRSQVLHGRVISHLISFLQLKSSLESMIFPNQQSLLVLQVEVSNWFFCGQKILEIFWRVFWTLWSSDIRVSIFTCLMCTLSQRASHELERWMKNLKLAGRWKSLLTSDVWVHVFSPQHLQKEEK